MAMIVQIVSVFSPRMRLAVTCEAVAKQWANGESVPRPVIHTDGFHEWSGPWGGPSSRWAGQDGVGGSFGDGVRWVTVICE